MQQSATVSHCMTVSVADHHLRDVCAPAVFIPFRSRLHSADNDDMIVPRTRTVRYGPRSFRVVAPQISNTLSSHITNINISRGQFNSRPD